MKWTILFALLIAMIWLTNCYPGKSINVIINYYIILFIVKIDSIDEKTNEGIKMICIFVMDPLTDSVSIQLPRNLLFKIMMIIMFGKCY